MQIKAHDNCSLHLTHWKPHGERKGTVLIIHGLGEHAERYNHVADYLNSLGYDVFAYDQRGHGRSEGQRAFAKNHRVFLNDLDCILNSIKGEVHERFFILGHSFGGNVLCSYLLDRGTSFAKGIIFSSSWFKLAFDPPKAKVFVANLLKGIFPRLSMNNELKTKDLSYDPKTIEKYEQDPLVHDRITASLFVNAYKAGLNCLENAERITLPVLVYHGADDEIISPEGSKILASKMKHATLKLWEKTKHEPHNDLRKEEVLVYLGEWLNSQP